MIALKEAGPVSALSWLCPYCKCELQEFSDVVRCASCNTSHHAGCWNLNRKKCSVFSCTSTSAVLLNVCLVCGTERQTPEAACSSCRELSRNKKVLPFSIALYVASMLMLTLSTDLQLIPIYSPLITIPAIILILAYIFASVFTRVD